MRTIFHSTESAKASSKPEASSPCTRCRPARRIKLLHLHHNFLAVSVYECYVFGECAMRSIAFYSFDCINLFKFTDLLVTFLLFFIQIVKQAVMRA